MMTNQTLLGVILLVLGVALFALIRWLTGSNRPDDGEGDAKRFDMPHEQQNKGFVEKGLTEGMGEIPGEAPAPSEMYSDDSYFSAQIIDDNSPPTDRF